MVNPIWLRSFCMLVDIGHFTRTAEKLHMTQSGVSQHIHKLETHLGQALLVRQGKKFTLTSTGERLYQEGQKIIQSLADIEQRIGIDPAHEGVVKIASPGSVGLKLYPYLLRVQKRFPKLIIDYRFAPNSDVERLISERKIDLGFMTCLSSLKDVSLDPVGEEELLLVTPAHSIKPSWDQLMGLGFVDHPDGAYHARQLLSVNFPQFQNSNQFKRSGFSNQINLILEPVSMGIGFTVLPRYAVDAFLAGDKIKAHSLPTSVSETLYMGVHANTFTPNRVATIILEVRQCLKSM